MKTNIDLRDFRVLAGAKVKLKRWPTLLKPKYESKMVLSSEHPRSIRYRSPEPVLTPELPQERHGTIANVVFPTGIDRRDDLGKPDRFDVYYGMADNRIGVARLDLPEHLPSSAGADKPE